MYDAQSDEILEYIGTKFKEGMSDYQWVTGTREQIRYLSTERTLKEY